VYLVYNCFADEFGIAQIWGDDGDDENLMLSCRQSCSTANCIFDWLNHGGFLKKIFGLHGQRGGNVGSSKDGVGSWPFFLLDI